ncbi:thyrotropin-releasing hormone receptor-like [Lingula anatina]|uniref:Thyrotropin-releasing hormone receptor n=1 Tax=Lingula anatina TaxID=7574 RepID=A0A1S3IZV0_LINAN|nr:thyrotropin-releasing hormone receptor-like [Lingula anatina]XP_013403725.1 thyrotropin-releasing hormone receptor-like [Lingula anatina]XP_013403726.1 thyrotropin-releasing hormone receptor-like [Lingula anatina]XP_013403727.1 thyrotropin-releasing hormone receptor-like [Lingula anatina]XP_013403728.1 thyrotropin-releasing hormone receptor-like [Lingula anatina]XP_013403729.1 thyrotropin-releasing hormone receptor-like [Lingula anatina]|eukprot:XP_013403724.1 thyrotropin-releasing hormone receptor-like [Lingula anatina]
MEGWPFISVNVTAQDQSAEIAVAVFPLNNTMENTTDNPLSNVTAPAVNIAHKVISITLGFLIFLVGILGNVLVIWVVTRTKTMHSTTNCYLVSLAAADCIVLLTATLPFTLGQFYKYGIIPYGIVSCALLTFFSYMGINVSSLSITAFTVERYIAICHPMKAYTICTISRAKKIIIALWVFSALYSAPWLALTKITPINEVNETTFNNCDYKLKRDHYFVYYLVDLVMFYILPLCLTAVLYFLIGRVLFSSERTGAVADSIRRRNRKNEKNREEMGSIHKKSSTRSEQNPSSRIQIVKMLAVIVVLFAVLWLPYRGLVVYNSVSSRPFLNEWFVLFCLMMIFLNSAINPILYNAMSKRFQRAFKRLLCRSAVKRKFGTGSNIHTTFSELQKEDSIYR